MCGIVGYIVGNKSFDADIVKQLLVLSETRGKEASGVAVITDTGVNYIYKQPVTASSLIKHNDYRRVVNRKDVVAVIGHTRLQTNGDFRQSNNNQPVLADNLIGVHNGIITNYDDLKNNYKIQTDFELDSFVLFKLLGSFLKDSNVKEGVDLLMRIIQGSASCLAYNTKTNTLLGFTNTGSLYYAFDDAFPGTVLFASESIILEKIIKSKKLKLKILQAEIGVPIFFSSICKKNLSKNIELDYQKVDCGKNVFRSKLNNEWDDIYQKSLIRSFQLKRCANCVLPETMPFIKFNENGVCCYCEAYNKRTLLGYDNFIKNVYKLNGGKTNKCIVPFSGGRDSSYALYILSEMGLKAVAYSYDWGMLTDLGRRNQARVVGKLGVEHIVVSANIEQKRINIRNNILAWMKNPNPGMIPLFMAGDKQYYYYAKKIANDFRSKLIIYGHNPLEETFFKVGFSGVNPVMKDGSYFKLNNNKAFKLFWFYFINMIKTPAYINSSLIDSLSAYFSYYGTEHNNIDLYDYVVWEENKINSVLESVFNWEKSSDTDSTWRIGDGTAPLYNYLYMFFAGFNEFDTFRSNQIRNGSITRKNALSQLENDHLPRFESIKWYFDTIKLDPNDFITCLKKYDKNF